MEKRWLKSYPPGVPAEIHVDENESLVSLLEASCARFAERPAFSNFGASITYDELERMSRAFGAYLQNALGLGKGDRVAVMMPNLLQQPVAVFGALRAGCTVVNTNPLYTVRELQHQLADSGATAIVVLDHFAHTLQEALPHTQVRHVIVSRIGDLLHFPKAQVANFVVKHLKHMVPDWHIDGALTLPGLLHDGSSMSLRDGAPRGGDMAFLQYTGGTTGTPKGAILTHRNLVANIRQTTAWVKGALEEGNEVAVIPLPLYHVFALTAMLSFFALGANNVLITNPRDIPAFLKELKHTKFSAMIGVNTLFNALLNAPGIEQIDTTAAKLFVAGGMAVQRGVAERWQRLFGMPIVEGYGLTETSPIVCANRTDINTYSGSIGLPIPSTEVGIFDEQDNLLPAGATGEICVRGPQVMQGYWNRPEETAHVFTADGWLRTGDIGCVDEQGYVRLMDRKKDVIVVSGFKVFPNEVEDVVAMHPGVLEVAAIATVDEHSDEVVKVVVVRKDPQLSADTLIEHCRKNLTAYKVPKYVVFREAPMPKSNIGKILRRLVKEEEMRAGRSDAAAADDGHREGGMEGQILST
ncbi:AMP-binding protein [Noviherbaspirillum sp. UKPF54]|uniref:AMP-binding protein n=1 Tax=Noviherbaspirillum sp. UKPF54 TaxID=2601898 RepID=UPI0011B171BC|nr:AMP-binding protein [Noviherbaspirillum sp. UKPF54]QDZ27188.1 long-chain-fatty-acid--CoA ligase [Noviherbaspirillum sp. UKPF54]